MNERDLLKNITPEVYRLFKEAIELGRWRDGTLLSNEQTEITMKAVILYEKNNLEEHQRVGFISGDDSCSAQSNEEKILKWSD